MWAYNSVFYQIYPIGFCGAPHENDGVLVPRIQKVHQFIPHLKQMGMDAVYFCPIFDSDRHGYDTRDYKTIDCRLGTNADFAAVCDDMHANGIRVVLDAVFNHVGRGFWAFEDVRQRKWDSPYKDWFHINFDGNSGYNDGFWYEGWEGHYELVKLNLHNPAVVDYLFDCLRGWVEEFQIDGLRLDVAYCLPTHFLQQLRQFCNGLKPEFYLIGELLHGDYNQWVGDDRLHSCTNYECYKGLHSSLNSYNLFEITHSLLRQFGSEQWCIYRGKKLLSFADNHDVTRAASILQNGAHLPLLYGLLFGMPGIPCIYYGSEWGAQAEKHQGDDALRPCFDAPVWNDLTTFLTQLIAARHASKALCHGDFSQWLLTNKQCVWARQFEGETVLVAVNIDGEHFNGHFNGNAQRAVDLISGETIELHGNQIGMAPYSVRYLKLVW